MHATSSSPAYLLLSNEPLFAFISVMFSLPTFEYSLLLLSLPSLTWSIQFERWSLDPNELQYKMQHICAWCVRAYMRDRWEAGGELPTRRSNMIIRIANELSTWWITWDAHLHALQSSKYFIITHRSALILYSNERFNNYLNNSPPPTVFYVVSGRF